MSGCGARATGPDCTPRARGGRSSPVQRAQRVLDSVGDTPLVPICGLNPYPDVRLLAKLEGYNPSGSLKDRIAKRMIEEAEASGRLKSGQTLIEPTSGNMGIALGLIGRLKGYEVVAVISPQVGVRKRRLLEESGARIVLSPPGRTDAAVRKARSIASAEPDHYCLLDQYANPQSVLAHYFGTGKEIWEQSGGEVDALVAPLGTGGTLMGAGRYLQEKNADLELVATAPKPGRHIEGLRDLSRDLKSAIYEPSEVDRTIYAPMSSSIAMARRMISEEGLSVGWSSGAALYAALRVARRMKKGTVVFICPDRADRYVQVLGPR